MSRIPLPELPDILKGHPTRFLKWAFVNAVYLVILAVAGITYKGHVHSIGLVAIAAVLALFVLVSSYAGYLCWKWDGLNPSEAKHLSLAIELAPKLAMLGTVGGFLLAFSSSAGDVQGRVLGASTGLAATFVGILTMVALEILRHVVED